MGKRVCAFRTDGLLRHLLPRVARLGIKVGLRLIGSVKTGSIYDGTCVIRADEVDILVMFDAYQVNSMYNSRSQLARRRAIYCHSLWLVFCIQKVSK